jgi:hypothetical protein
MYEKVENKVIFGDFESDWFDQEFGLKQGCVLSPTFFSILMTDLANMLENSSIGANISSKLINCLLFADDVVLIAESPEELQELLNIPKSPNITLFSTFSYIFLSSLQHFPFIPFSHSNAKRPSRQTLSKAFDRSKKAK